ncbi:bifunctional phosphoribosylaminoimidazolecarboxamide formyltransferase/inosine monophosphate cyclohydrolase [Candidatus Marinamargulisbacteria bacterium SCGC AG-410-N11]|nr:bifunctional phosphoribosylaminoimidazolecarboxamide formyltransferase/inosine monophosphate cyclohydrolase [Candidatus Marinamargulisbacteria bacterium SCGC AG-410-N11]
MKALISVSNKEGIVEFANELASLGFEIISTGGTYKKLTENQIQTTTVENITQFPEMLNGRVKTLHPKIFAGILADRKNKSHIDTCNEHDLPLIDLVIVNLYPFEETIQQKDCSFEKAIENIDIGGPSMIRAAAKNHESIAVIVNPNQYTEIINELKNNNNQLSIETKKNLATEAFQHTARYDSIIANYFTSKTQTKLPNIITPVLHKVCDLRYGENPHQVAGFYKDDNKHGLPNLKQLNGKELSFNNLLDIQAAIQIVKEFNEPCSAIIKHNNPCGVAIGKTALEAYKKAHEADPVSAFGSIVSINQEIDESTAEEISKTFVEVIVAPHFTEKALTVLKTKPNLRLITVNFTDLNESYNFKHVDGGFLVQSSDTKIISKSDLTVVTQTQPSDQEIKDLLFAFKVVKYVKSNAILLANNGQVTGIGAGQMSRVEAVELAIKKAKDIKPGTVMASDAFFPFKDSIEIAKNYNIHSIIQPGGSKRDNESIESCNSNNISMVFTGTRHFRH